VPDPRDHPAQLVELDIQAAMETMDHPDPEAHLDHLDKMDIQDLPASLVNPAKLWIVQARLAHPAQQDLKAHPVPMVDLDNLASPVTMADPDPWEMADTMVELASPETQEAKAPMETLETRAPATTARHHVPLPDIKQRLYDQVVDGDSSLVLRIATTLLLFDFCNKKIIMN